ncbi:MAG TPA: PA14 domain-containing protein [Polyangia bacterium]|nr:PA14 domain-containing protein [Polyangia bacterium]
MPLLGLAWLLSSCAGSGAKPGGTDSGTDIAAPGTDVAADVASGNGGAMTTDVPPGTNDDGGQDPDASGAPPVDPRKTLGISCTSADQCRSGFCVDGVCCSQACDGACFSCAVSGSVGTCTPAEIGTDPRDMCPDQGLASCGTDGACDGAGACRKYPAGVTCLASTCSGSTMNLVSRCDGSGACVPTASQSCAPFTCDATVLMCRTTCKTDADCSSPNTCVAGSCGKKPLGSACTTADQCNSAFCEQGTCCGTACDGVCKSCALPGTAGTCSTVPAGQDPLGQCADNGAATCGTDGTCNGAGACRKYPSSTVCAATSCSAGTESGSRRCDGNGTCLAGATRPCEPFACGASGTCLSACTSSSDCGTDFVCIGGTCVKKSAGAACLANPECATGFCQQGVCCNRSCTGGCRACNLAGFAGTCTPVPPGQDPLSQCADTGANGCGTNGRCDGNGACQLYVSGTVCGPGACSGATQTLASRCNGGGACVAGTQQDCAPYSCAASGGACNMTCTINTECSASNVCVNASCGKRPIGGACAGNSECGSGFCAQGFCCNSACTGTCMSCAVSGSVGTCSAVLNGAADPQGTCMDKGAASCGTDGLCNGKGACRLYNGSTQCAPASCVGSTLTPARSCDGVGVCTTASTSSCQAFQCDTATNMCRQSCTADNQCTSPNVCIGGVCRKKDIATTCSSDDQCASGFCQQGVCCASSCTGTCRSCAVPGKAGACINVPAHGSSAGACTDDGQTSCKHDGLCDGAGNCEQYASGLTCGPATCTNANVVGISTCNGSGACVTGSSTSCKPFACDTNAMCKTTCTSNTDCVSPSTCINGACGGGKSNGQTCGSGVECVSTFCSPQNVCCDTACNGTCVSCNITNSVGTCKNVTAGQSPAVAGQCMDQGMATCGTNGSCNGSGACQFYADGTPCVGAMCSGSTFTPARTCSAHTCQTATGTSCGDYTCNTTGCLKNCATDNDCAGTNKCFGALCGGLKGDYFKLSDINTPTWSGTPTHTRVDGNIDFEFGGSSPFTPGAAFLSNTDPSTADVAFPNDGFTARWTGTLTSTASGTFFFQTFSDDGVSLWVKDLVNPIIAQETLKGGDLRFTSGAVNLTANQPVSIRLEYFENTGNAKVHLLWSSNTSDTDGNTNDFVVIPTSRLTPAP